MAEEQGKGTPHILHCHSGFDLGGKEARAVRLMNQWGGRLRHTILSAAPHQMGARGVINGNVVCDFPQDAGEGTTAPSLIGKPGPLRYWRLARYMARFDLVLSYNWGAMDAVMAHRLWSPFMRLPAIIHHEDGFNEDETARLNSKRNWFRRIGLTSAAALVVPSQRLADIARTEWGLAEGRVEMIPNGIDVYAYSRTPMPDAIPDFVRQPGKLVVGTLAGLRQVKNLPLLVRAVKPLAARLQLVIVGEGAEREAIDRQARALGLTELHMPGFLPEPWRFMGLFDIFALSSDSEQFPISLIEAMAAGLPAVSTDVGDVRNMVAKENLPFIVPPRDEAALSAALAALVEQPEMRAAIGAANRERARSRYGEADMIARYADLYSTCLAERKNRMSSPENLL